MERGDFLGAGLLQMCSMCQRTGLLCGDMPTGSPFSPLCSHVTLEWTKVDTEVSAQGQGHSYHTPARKQTPREAAPPSQAPPHSPSKTQAAIQPSPTPIAEVGAQRLPLPYAGCHTKA